MSRIYYVKANFKSLPKARNQGIAIARGEIIVFVDDDVEPGINFISSHTAPYVNLQIVSVTGPVLEPGQEIKSRIEIGEKEYLSLLAKTKTRFDVNFEFYAGWAPGCNFSFRKKVVERIGGFDENFIGVALGEDAEFSGRIRKNKGLICYTPFAYVTHRKVHTGGCSELFGSGKYVYEIAYNANYFWFKIDTSDIRRYWMMWREFKGSLFKLSVILEGKFFYYCANFVRGFRSSEKLIQRFKRGFL